ncbi:MAG TPA: hypothetical protein VL992_13780 [Tepidisphaeraceae bacterium]|nr:hypothetical protein [Tepidisphaeraceae bacterium]
MAVEKALSPAVIEWLERRVLLTTSSLVYPGPSGHLVYVPNPVGDEIPNFSMVGYETGDVPLPDTTGGVQVPIMETVNPGSGDMTSTIQNAINAVEAMPLNSNGFRGAVLLTAGNYPISGDLNITASGVVLEGQGNNSTTGTRLEATGTSTRMLINVTGGGGPSTVSGTTKNITDSYVPVGATTFHVSSTSGMFVGETVDITRPSPENWIDAIGMEYLDEPWTAGSRNLNFYVTVTAINGTQVTINAPLTNSLSSEYGGGTIAEYTWSKAISQDGIENLYTYSDSTSSTDANHANGMLDMSDVTNSYVNNVTSDGYASNQIELGFDLYVTLDNMTVENTSDTGAAPPSGVLTSAQLTLVENSTFLNTYHAIAIGSQVAGPDVYYNIQASGTGAGVGPHQRWSTGGLFDNVTVQDTQLQVIQAGNYGTGHGWEGANYVFWNDQNNTEIDVYSPPTAQNWAIGGSATTVNSYDNSQASELGIMNEFGTVVSPTSLYLAQLADRETPTVATAASASVSSTTVNLSVLGADVAGESDLTYTWSVLSAPTGAPAVTFSANGTNASKNSVATVGQAGLYTFLATIQFPGGFAVTSSVSVTVSQTLKSIVVAPGYPTINEDTPQQFTALGFDQFGNPDSLSASWSTTGGSISAVGLLTSPSTGGGVTVTATSGAVSGSTTITVDSAPAVIASAASASPMIVTGTTTNLSALAAGDTGNFVYTWSVASQPSGAATPTLSVNGTNAAQNTTATFTSAGDYTFLVTVSNSGVTVGTSSVTVAVNQTLTKVTTSPASAAINENSTKQFTATATDQFGNPDSVSIAWSATTGSVGSGGLMTSGVSTGTFSVTASSGGVSDYSSLTVINGTPTIVSPASASPSPVMTTTTNLNVLGADDGGESNLTYTWSVTSKPSGAATPTFAINDSNAAKSDVVTFYTEGTYSFLVTVTDAGGLSTTSSVTVAVQQSATTFTVSPASATVAEGAEQEFTAIAYDQFGVVMPSQPSITWSVSEGGAGGTISTTGAYTAPSVLGTDTVQAGSGFAFGQATVTVIAASLGIFSANQDIGAPAIAGSSDYNTSTGVYSVSGAGADISGTSDQFQYLYESITGDASITAEVTSITNTNTAAKAGVMFRNTLDAGGADVLLCVTPSNGIKLEGRTSDGATATIYDATSDSYTAPYWIRLVRVGNAFAGFMSPNGVNWTLLGLVSTTMNSTIYVGLAVSSHNTSELNTSTFQSVAIGPATSTWTGGGDGINWGNALNWAPNAVPDQSDNVSIPSGVANLTVAAGTYAAAGVNSSSSITISGGSLALFAASVIGGSLTIQSGGILDLTAIPLVINYAGSADPISKVQSYLSSGYNNGAWNGSGIVSSYVAAANSSGRNYAVGYADGADAIVPGLSSGQIEILPTLLGDATLQGNVSFGDFQVLAEYFGRSGGWDEGNFAYGGAVTFGDFQLLAAEFGRTSALAAGMNLASSQTGSLAAAAARVPAASTLAEEEADNDSSSSILDGTIASAGNGLPRFSDVELDLS